MSNEGENYYAPIVCHWVCTNNACSEYGLLKGCAVIEWEGVTCGRCGNVCTKQALPEVPA